MCDRSRRVRRLVRRRPSMLPACSPPSVVVAGPRGGLPSRLPPATAPTATATRRPSPSCPVSHRRPPAAGRTTGRHRLSRSGVGELFQPVGFSSMVGRSAGLPVRVSCWRGAPWPRRGCPQCRASADAVGLTVADVGHRCGRDGASGVAQPPHLDLHEVLHPVRRRKGFEHHR